jgi:IS30 family transposase
MKDAKSHAQIAAFLERHKLTISRVLARNMGLKDIDPNKPAISQEPSNGSRNAAQITPNQ